MYAQLYIAPRLPSMPNALNYQRALVAGNWLMLASIALISVCISVGYVFEQSFSLPALIAAHLAMIVLAGLVKIGYVMRCIALKAFGDDNF